MGLENLESCTHSINPINVICPSNLYKELSAEYRGSLITPSERIFISWRGPNGNSLSIPFNDSIQIYSYQDNRLSYSNSLFGGHTKVYITLLYVLGYFVS